MKGYARWIYLGALQGGTNIIDHNNVTGQAEAMSTYMRVRSQLSVNHDEYCVGNNEFMCHRRYAMAKFLKNAKAEQTKDKLGEQRRRTGHTRRQP